MRSMKSRRFWAAVGMCELMLRRKPEGSPSVKFFAERSGIAERPWMPVMAISTVSAPPSAANSAPSSSTPRLIGLALAGIVPVFLGNQWGDILSIIVALGGLGAAGYHIPMHRMKKSEVCKNRFSYVIMVALSVLCVLLLTTLFW